MNTFIYKNRETKNFNMSSMSEQLCVSVRLYSTQNMTLEELNNYCHWNISLKLLKWIVRSRRSRARVAEEREKGEKEKELDVYT